MKKRNPETFITVGIGRVFLSAVRLQVGR